MIIIFIIVATIFDKKCLVIMHIEFSVIVIILGGKEVFSCYIQQGRGDESYFSKINGCSNDFWQALCM